MCNCGVNPPSRVSAPACEADDEFARSFRASFRVLWCIAAGIVGNADTAEDIVQEAAVIGLGKYEQFRGQPGAGGERDDAVGGQPGSAGSSPFDAWMGQIVRYVALNRYRKDRVRRSVPLSDNHVSHQPGPEHRLTRSLKLTRNGQLPEDQQAFDDQVLEALREIGDVARACLLLRSIESLEYQQIGRLLDIPPGTAMSHVHRARQALRRRLAQREPRTPGGKKLKA